MAETSENAAETSQETQAPIPADPIGRLRVAFARLSNTQKIVLAVVAAAVVALLVGVWLWSRQPGYRVLFTNFSDKDGAAIIAALEQSAVPYRLAEGGAAILVPAGKVHEVRLRLAGQGLPRGGSVGFELMENQKFGISQFAEQVNYQRALEGELSRTIESIAAVEAARVHLAIPKPSVFVREEQKPTASVLLRLQPGWLLTPSQVAGISYLVASSVPQLVLANVTITDQDGNLLSQLKDRKDESKLDRDQLAYVHEIEANVIKRINDILVPVVGEGNYRTQVAADLDFAQIEQTAEIFGPNTPVRSEQVSESANMDRPPLPRGGVPGALSNQPPVPGIAPITQPEVGGANQGMAPPNLPTPTSLLGKGQIDVAGVKAPVRDPVTPPFATQRDTTRNNEVDKTIRHTRQPLGRIQRLTAAVVVNYRMETDAKSGKRAPRPMTDGEIAQITSLVREAMGYNSERGDSVSVANAPFAAAAEPLASAPFWKNPEYVAPGLEIVKYLVLAAIALLFYWILLRPIFRTMFPPPEKPVERKPGEAGAEGDEEGEGEGEEGGEVEAEIDPFAKKLAEARAFTQENSKAVAHIINDWLNPG
ncbi:MAG: flagellar M-ring protein FliF [Zoogloeaceae bacterium]|jgi:flagellar M-ring protein FliF|nr:flagellar M-ring protein FliF [Zoogloeaceae bacterium]